MLDMYQEYTKKCVEQTTISLLTSLFETIYFSNYKKKH